VSSIGSVGTKQSFLLWDRVYQKITDEEDEIWLLRAIETSLFYFSEELSKDEALRCGSDVT
jgi:hypothetical protein